MAKSLEAHSHEIIDKQLKVAGWRVAPANAKLQLTPDVPVVLCEEKLDRGRADYVLYLDGKACGIIETKRPQHFLQGVQEQSMTYSAPRNWRDPSNCWQSLLPFRFEANGTQIQFSDGRDPQPRARPIFHSPNPRTLRHLLTRASAPDDTLRRCLKELPGKHPLSDFMAGAAQPLRDCQHEAITGLEASLADARPRSLIHMATGAGIKPLESQSN